MVKIKIINKSTSATTDEERCAEEILNGFNAYFISYPRVLYLSKNATYLLWPKVENLC